MTTTQARGDLTIVSETALVSIPRGDDELRVTFTRARTADGKDVAWHSIRVFFRGRDGEWKPGKQGITIRGRELAPIRDALIAATSGGAR